MIRFINIQSTSKCAPPLYTSVEITCVGSTSTNGNMPAIPQKSLKRKLEDMDEREDRNGTRKRDPRRQVSDQRSQSIEPFIFGEDCDRNEMDVNYNSEM